MDDALLIRYSWRFQGTGVFAIHPIPKGLLLFELTGNELSVEELPDSSSFDDGPALIQIAEHRYFALDAPGSYLNHSCEPNCCIRHDRLVFTLRDISPNEELTYDYSTMMNDGSEFEGCLCGSKRCRKTIRDFIHLPEDVRHYYLSECCVATHIVEK